MIQKMEFIPTTAESYPFQAAAGKCNFEAAGYVEDEYFMSGTANVYTEKGLDHAVTPRYENCPYTTRLIVRRPKDVSQFSGNVVVEILNASACMDIDRMWVNTWKFIMRHGDIYIGISSKGHVVDALKRFDGKRYEKINWANPDPSRKIPDKSKWGIGPFMEQYESGLYWDMQNDLARLLRTEDPLNPIREYGRSYLYLLGWSQSTLYVNRTIHSFANQPGSGKGRPLFDGYLMAGGDSSLAPINAYEPADTDGRIFMEGSVPAQGQVFTGEPVIAINTESENRGANWGTDADVPGYRFRSWQLPGTSHDTKYNLLDYYEGYLARDTEKIGQGLSFAGVEGEPLDVPYQYIFQAALNALYVWVRDNVPAPHAPRIETAAAGEEDCDPIVIGKDAPSVKVKNLTDAFGNAKGGIRIASVEYPVGRYSSACRRKDGSYDALFGTVYPFSSAMLTELYGNLEKYRGLIEQNAEELMAAGFLLPDDWQDYVAEHVEIARKRGLGA